MTTDNTVPATKPKAILHDIEIDDNMATIIMGALRTGDVLNEKTLPVELMRRLKARGIHYTTTGRKPMRIHATFSGDMSPEAILSGIPKPCPIPLADRVSSMLDMLDANDVDEADVVTVRRSSCQTLLDSVEEALGKIRQLDYLAFVTDESIPKETRDMITDIRSAIYALEVSRLPLLSTIGNAPTGVKKPKGTTITDPAALLGGY